MKEIVAGGLLLAAAATQAQASGEKGLSFHVGQFYPKTKLAKDYEGGRWFLAGIEYDTSGKYNLLGPDVRKSVTADVYSKGSLTGVPILFNASKRDGRFLIGGGVGVSFIHRKDAAGLSLAETQFGYQLFVSYDLKAGDQPFFVAGRYIGNSREDLTGLGLSVGTRF